MTQKMQANLLFNPKGQDDVAFRTIIKGNTTGLFQLNATKYSWAKSLYQVMVGNFWIPEKVSGLGEDAIQFHNSLTDDERRAYKGILSFLIFLDSIQTVNLPNFSEYITAPEVNLILAIQAYQEAIHSQSYAAILETVVDSKDRNEIYYFWRTDKHLLERNEFIGGIYQDFIDKPNDDNFFRGIIGNFLLESIYFYNGFAFFDTLADQGKMVATDRMINYIRRDELTHVTIFANMLKEIKKEFPDMYNEKIITDMMETAVSQEIKWSKHILGKNIIGMGHENIENYTKWLANERLNMLGIKPLYPNVVKNPYKHLDRLQDQNAEKGNFFESTVTNYAQSSAMNGSWDF
ncbi:MAG: ribonucleotide-diphosphate reductase subunit beta [Candidatus Gracilibacteria bacterium]|nr:ribonucleotide-diphosphate reductase subunit beta [Candidatus Gracilibacteria bacterium]